MKYAEVIFASLGSIIALFFSAKLIGNKQLSQFNMFDYINGITIGSIAAEMALSFEDDFLSPLIAITVYTLIVVFLSFLSRRNIKLSRLFSGHAVVLMDNNKIYHKNFNKAKLEIGEFLTQCRINGFFDLNDIQTAVLEENGMISILPKAYAAPLTLKDLNIPTQKKRASVTVIYDGVMLSENLRYTGNNEEWLMKKLKELQLAKEDVFIGMCDSDNNLVAYKKIDEAPQTDPFH